MSCRGNDFQCVPDAPPSFNSPPSSVTKNKTRSLSEKMKSKKNTDTREGSRSDSESEPGVESPYTFPRPPSTPSYYPPLPPPSFYPYPPYPPDGDVHPPIPLQDPRAQFIISQAMQQAMHQLSTLFTAPWSAQPFTPPRHPSSSRSANSSPYSYPTTPHRPHSYPYVFNSGASVGTLPPSSPIDSSPSLSSSPTRGSGAGRRASLVPRSRSRGRRVSFRLDEQGTPEESIEHSELRGRRRYETQAHQEFDDTGPGPSGTKRKDKGKEKMAGTDLSDPETGAQRRLAERAQTPGPPIARDETPNLSASAKTNHRPSTSRSDSSIIKPKGKIRKATR
ncbi:hypothetical protein C8R43DRAFT_1042902 [Mycena crocata]|nr:hypothetical protein C8R43DRAFT_1042902 [Mycena crocata]